MMMKTKFFARLLVPLICCMALLPAPADGHEASSESPFLAVPEGLESAVEFWKRVFTVYDSSQLIFLDPMDPATIYAVVRVEDERDVRRFVKAEIKRLSADLGVDEKRIRSQRGIKDRFAAGLARSGRYIGQIQEIFSQHRLPVELGYLPLVESSFNVQARSHAGAVGMWQFIRSTGRLFLRVDGLIDERKDPIESTRAAARLLGQNYQRLGSWPLAITAYNHGPEGVSRGVAKVGSSELVELIRNYQSPSWGFASKNFYAEFLAALEVARNAERYFPGLEYDPPFPLAEIALEKTTPVAALLKTTGLARDEFFRLNPALSPRMTVVPHGYRVKFSAARPEPVLQTASAVSEPAMIRHRVRRGETLSQIAGRYAASVAEIKEINGLQKIHLIAVGQELLIPAQ